MDKISRGTVCKYIQLREGLRLKPYRCTSGKLTIGYGRNIEDNGISEPEAYGLLLNDLDRAIEDALKLYPSLWEFDLARQLALIDMSFNMGYTRLAKFKLMNAAVNRGDWETAANQAVKSKWYSQVGGRSRANVEMIRTAKMYNEV